MPEFPHMKKYDQSKYDVEGFEKTDAATSIAIESSVHRGPEFTPNELEKESTEVRLHYHLYTDEDTHRVCSDGRIIEIDNLQMARIARLSGAPMAKGAGVDLFCKLGAEVECSTPLYRIYAEYPSEFEFACACAELDCGFRIAAPGAEDTQRDLHEK